ncbi:MAG: 23S rRNA (uracil(1939)-C(5))-methyltransferase RlmD [Firmicutes bacterium]|jgi:23S rRNA (uracil-5-)-methyltransferase RumA|nr:23S rRNA (uracil(1939)-C(5))-methyltransferase RlmD [Bacillota bacterium]
MRKRKILDILIEDTKYPNVGVGYHEDKRVEVKGVLKGQEVKVKITRSKKDKMVGKLLEVLKQGEMEESSFCEHFGQCGGCSLQTLSYENQLKHKEYNVKKLLENGNIENYEFFDIIASPLTFEYRNKMEFSFGNEMKGGETTLGMHKKGRVHDVVTVDKCHLVDEDYRKILTTTLAFFKDRNIDHFNRKTHEGFVRHFTIRKSIKTKEILIGLSAVTETPMDKAEFVEVLRGLDLDGEIVGILHIQNDNISDMVQGPIDILYGRDYYMEELLGLKFKVSFYSFFQTNPIGAEVLYTKAIDYLGDIEGKKIFDLFTGTGTIAQVLSQKAKEVIGIEIVEDAVIAARENAKLNNLDNCTFIAGDVFDELDKVKNNKPDMIVVDPPRMGITEKALNKIIKFGAKEMVYISCNPKTLVDNLVQLEKSGYKVKKVVPVDMFPHTPHCEVICKLERV